jgi:arylsulfatase A-like enzyme
MKVASKLTVGLCALLAHPGLSAFAAGKAEHVVVVVWDGMRPDFVTPIHTPTLYSLATNGVFFKNHHPVYVSSTEVNGTALATGVYPDRSGVMANTDYRPEIGWLSSFGTESLDAVRRADLLSSGNYLLAPTVAEILQDNGIPTVIAGTKPVTLLHDRSARKHSEAEKNSVTLFKGLTIPRSIQETLPKVNEDKAFPTNTTHPNSAADAWTTRSLTHALWKKGVPKYTVLWLSDPDASQHEASPGSDTALASLESVDKQLSNVLKALEEKKVLDKTDVLVVSDHGFSTIWRAVDTTALLKKAKFNAAKRMENPEPGDVVVIGLGGSVSLYVIDRDEAVTRRLVDFFQHSDFAGVIFSRVPVEGTFPLSTVRIGTSNTGPDVLVSMRWNGDLNQYGAPGLFVTEGGTKNKGSHASLSYYDMHNTLVAAGPDFKKSFIDEWPTGNADVPPTVLYLLGVSPPSPMDGRVLYEALADCDLTPPQPETKTIEATRDLGLFRWRQYLKISKVGKALYFDEGNGERLSK